MGGNKGEYSGDGLIFSHLANSYHGRIYDKKVNINLFAKFSKSYNRLINAITYKDL